MEFIIVNVTEKKNKFSTLDTVPSIVIFHEEIEGLFIASNMYPKFAIATFYCFIVFCNSIFTYYILFYVNSETLKHALR